MRSGGLGLHITAGVFRNAGQCGYGRSSRANAYYMLRFVDNIIEPSISGNASDGYPLRCLSTVLGM